MGIFVSSEPPGWPVLQLASHSPQGRRSARLRTEPQLDAEPPSEKAQQLELSLLYGRTKQSAPRKGRLKKRGE